MRYHAFMSHSQADASGTVAMMCFAYEALGLHNWVDMRQSDLTLEGMRKGVRDSDVFLLVLTEHVLASWYCQQEMLQAIASAKKIQLLLEEGSHFAPFDMVAWEASRGQATRMVSDTSGTPKEVPPEICKMIDDRLAEAVTSIARADKTQNAWHFLAHNNMSVSLLKTRSSCCIKREARFLLQCHDLG